MQDEDDIVESPPDVGVLVGLPFRVWEATPWRVHAACRGDDASHLFFAPEGERPEGRDAREHFAIVDYCLRCPVMTECRAYARRNREFGVWGGETELERAAAGYGHELAVGTVQRMRREASTYGPRGV